MLPASGPNATSLEQIVDDLRQNCGSACLLRVADEAGGFVSLFDLNTELGALLGELASGRNSLEDNTALDALASATRRLLHQTSGTQSRCASSRAKRVTFGATSG